MSLRPNSALEAAIAAPVNAAIEQRIFPGAVVLVIHHGTVCSAAAFGHSMYDDPGSQPVTVDTPYDIASITKVFTMTATLRLLDDSHLHLDTAASHYLPGLRASGVTVRHLLTHTSGLSLRLSLLRDRPPQEIRAAIYATEPAYPPGSRVAYVNINSLLLGDIVAHVSGMPLDQSFETLLLHPLGMESTCFNPPPSLRPHIPPTEWDEAWRGGLVQGTVHDESTHALGGVAGHAGLFSTAADLGRFMQMWLDGGGALLRRETVAMATRVQTSGLQLPTEGLAFHCGLGWMLGHPVIMPNAPLDTYGHTGFTGPTLVLVPSRHLGLVILSNRTYPRRTPMVHHPVTAAVLEAALAHLPD